MLYYFEYEAHGSQSSALETDISSSELDSSTPTSSSSNEPPLLPTELELTPISKSKQAQARFAKALEGIIAPYFDPTTSASHDAHAASVARLAFSLVATPTPTIHVPSTAQAVVPVSLPSPPPSPPAWTPPVTSSKTHWVPPPTHQEALAAYHDLKSLLHPTTGRPFQCDACSRKRYDAMLDFLNFFTHPNINQRLPWMEASVQASQLHGHAKPHAESLRRWTRRYVEDRSLPQNLYGRHSHSKIENQDLAEDIIAHLRTIGDSVTSTDLIHYTEELARQDKFGLKKGISMATAKRWMETLGYKQEAFESAYARATATTHDDSGNTQ